MIVKLQTDYNLEFLSLKGGCRGSSESTLVQIVGNLMHSLIIICLTYPLRFVRCKLEKEIDCILQIE